MSDFSAASSAFMDAPDTGASDAAPDADGAPEATAPAEAPSSAPASEPAAPEQGRDPVPWGEYNKVQQEAARYRPVAQQFEQAFQSIHPDDAQVILGVINLLGTDPAQGAKALREIANVFGPEAAQAVSDAADAAGGNGAEPDDDSAPMTRAEFKAMMVEQGQQQQIQSQVQQLHAWAQEKGLAPDQYIEVLGIAQTLTNNDVDAALKMYEDRRQAVIDQYLAGKQQTAAEGVPVADGAAPVPQSEAPHTIEDASAKLRGYLESQT